MIRIKPYTELSQKDEIFNLYLYLASNAMPFYPEDIFPEGYYYRDGKVKTDISKYIRQPRSRTKNYIKLLEKYNISVGSTITEKKKSDVLLAEKIIQSYSEELHKFLYEDMSDGHIIPDNLRTLLLASVSFDSLVIFSFFKEAHNSDTDFKKEEKMELLKYVFRYKEFRNQKDIYRFVSLLGVEVCPYCNRLFTTTVTKGKQIGPQLDHYRSKSKYPFLALSILNLVPCCGVCNHIKGNDPTEILYPYEEEMGERCSFSVDAERDLTVLTGARINHDELTITLKQLDKKSPIGKHIKASIDLLNLKEVYQSHKGYVSDLLFQRYVFTDEMVKEIMNSFPDLFKNEKEVREMLLLNKFDREHWGDRPLGKLTHDISEELDFLYNNKNY